MRDRGIEIVQRMKVLNCVLAEFICHAVTDAQLYSGSGQPHVNSSSLWSRPLAPF
ncbi:hypothetical protein Poly59_28190 [Rubripirellula reticaptiva]|uniref:Uncharacterized protein n=1 Tax=Rubripirellula reticaptiva TaxID=2528013 RepID=A0A5C6ET19_9BACT|nr:hypothetical protein Poly59_28190 [Rubripirellula reticaptiva]